ncbi:cytochrome P450 [Nemania abortiva]|nr:cytochrome P450 [Nemania abortiva]
MAASDFTFTLVKYAALILIPYLAFVFGYQLFLHPLRAYPGPVLARFSDLYAGFYALGMTQHLVTYRDLRKYGPVIRHGPNRLVFSSLKAFQDIYNNERVTKSHVYKLTIASGKPSIFNSIDRQKHRERRKLVGKSITDKAMRAFEPTMLEQIDIFIEQIRLALSSKSGSKGPQHVNMTDLTGRLGADIVGHLAFGYAMNTQTDLTNRFVLRALAVGSYLNNVYMQLPMLKKLGLDNLLILLSSFGSRTKYKNLLQKMIKERRSQESHAKNDLYSFIVDHLDHDGSKNGIKTSEMWSEALFFFPAGGDTTKTALSALFFYLAHHRDVYDKLAAEIRQTFEDEASIRGGPLLASCRYLRACIDEALRMSPPVSGTLWRELYSSELDKGPFIVDGHVIPPGTQVGVSFYALHHDEKYFDDPFTFRPDRWLTEDRDALNRMNSAFNPFSIGARGCAGKAMAYLETSLVLAKTIWRFDFKLAPGKLGQVGMAGENDGGKDSLVEFQIYDSFSSRHDGPNLVFHTREL